MRTFTMIRRGSLALLAAGCLCAWGGAAGADVLLFGWNGSSDGWTSSHIVGTTPSGDRGVTEGAGALVFTGGFAHWNSDSDRLKVVPTASVLQALEGHTEISFDAIQMPTNLASTQNISFDVYFKGKDASGSAFNAAVTFDSTNSSGTWNGENRVNANQATLVWNYSQVAGGDLTAGTVQSLDAIYIDAAFAGGAWANDTNNQAVIDNFKVLGTPVPEPATLALFGLGGLAMLSRRRNPGREG